MFRPQQYSSTFAALLLVQVPVELAVRMGSYVEAITSSTVRNLGRDWQQ
jgi:hypothetical protein